MRKVKEETTDWKTVHTVGRKGKERAGSGKVGPSKGSRARVRPVVRKRGLRNFPEKTLKSDRIWGEGGGEEKKSGSGQKNLLSFFLK